MFYFGTIPVHVGKRHYAITENGFPTVIALQPRKGNHIGQCSQGKRPFTVLQDLIISWSQLDLSGLGQSMRPNVQDFRPPEDNQRKAREEMERMSRLD